MTFLSSFEARSQDIFQYCDIKGVFVIRTIEVTFIVFVVCSAEASSICWEIVSVAYDKFQQFTQLWLGYHSANPISITYHATGNSDSDSEYNSPFIQRQS